VPCYNEEEVLPELYERLSRVCSQEVGDSFELVFVNDGSSDETWSSLKELVAEDAHIVAINLSRNFGHQVALSAGLEFARGGRILVLDADLQDPPELLHQMMKVMDAGADVAYGLRRIREGETYFKVKSAELFYRVLNSLTNIQIPVDTGDFRLISRRVKEELCAMPERQRFIRGMVSWLGYKQVGVPYERSERFAGKTKYSLRKMFLFALDAVTSFSLVPIRLSVLLALLFALLSGGLFAFVIVSWFVVNTVPGWASLGFIVTFLGAGQFLVLGIVGEYVGRVYIESKSRPLFLIESIHTQNSDDEG
jgi:dolichol-phosphate mannosyltransferase